MRRKNERRLIDELEREGETDRQTQRGEINKGGGSERMQHRKQEEW